MTSILSRCTVTFREYVIIFAAVLTTDIPNLAHVLLVLNYRQTSKMRHTKSQNLNVFSLVLQLSLYNILKPGVKSRIQMWLEQRRQVMLKLQLSIQQCYCSKVHIILEV